MLARECTVPVSQKPGFFFNPAALHYSLAQHPWGHTCRWQIALFPCQSPFRFPKRRRVKIVLNVI